MNFNKKISIFLFFILCFNFLNVNARIDSTIYKELILSKNKLSKTVKLKKYITQIDKLIIKIGDNEKVLNKIDSKILKLKEKLKDDNSEKNKDIKNIINYLYGKIKIALDSKIDNNSIEVIENKTSINEEGFCKYIEDDKKYNNIQTLIISPDNKSYVYGVYENGKSFIVKDGVEIDRYDSIQNYIYSPDGKSFSFYAKKDGKSIIVKDGVEIDKYDEVGYPYYSLDGSKFYFSASKNGKFFVVLNGVEVNHYKDPDLNYKSPIQPFGDETGFSLEINNDGEIKVIKQKISNYMRGDIDRFSFTYSNDGKNIAYIVKKDGKNILINNGKEVNKYDDISNPVYSKDGKHFAFEAILNNKSIIVKDGIEMDDYSSQSSPIFSPLDNTFVFVGFKDKKYFIVTEKCSKQIINQKIIEKKLTKGEIVKENNVNKKIYSSKDLITLPKEYENLKSEEKNIFSAYNTMYFYNDNKIKELLNLPVVTNIKFINEKSIRDYVSDEEREEELIKIFDEQKEALNSKKDITVRFGGEYMYKNIGGRGFHIGKRVCKGDIYGCTLIKYITFEGDEKIELDVGFSSSTKDENMDILVGEFFGE